MSVGKDTIEGVHVVRVASTRSSSTMSRAPDHAAHHQRVGDYVILATALPPKDPVVAAADHQILGGLTRTAAECEPASSAVVCGHHSERRSAPSALGGI